MIILSKINEVEYKEVNSILKKENIMDNLDDGIIYTLKDNEVIIGVGKIKFNFNYATLKYIIIKKEYRGDDLGDGLLRTLLFKAETSGIKKVFYADKDNYLIKKGFTQNTDEHMNSYKLHLKTWEFFNRGCCGDENAL